MPSLLDKVINDRDTFRANTRRIKSLRRSMDMAYKEGRRFANEIDDEGWSYDPDVLLLLQAQEVACEKAEAGDEEAIVKLTTDLLEQRKLNTEIRKLRDKKRITAKP